MKKIITKDNSGFAWLLVGKAREYMIKAREQELAPYGISHRQAYVADSIYNSGHSLTLTELAKLVDRGVNTLSYQMIRMEKDGLVKKVREKPKSTLLKFELTEKGVTAYKNSLRKKSIKKIMSVLSSSEREELISMLQKLICAAQKYKLEEK